MVITFIANKVKDCVLFIKISLEKGLSSQNLFEKLSEITMIKDKLANDLLPKSHGFGELGIDEYSSQ